MCSSVENTGEVCTFCKRVREVLDHRTFNQVNKRQSALFAGMPTLLCLCQCMGQANTMLFWTHLTYLRRVWVNLALKYALHFYAYCNKNKRGTSVQVIPNKQFRSST